MISSSEMKGRSWPLLVRRWSGLVVVVLVVGADKRDESDKKMIRLFHVLS
jgi:hypothetical protein